MPLFLRPTLPQDEQFVYRLAYETMYEQLYAWTWDPQIRHQLLDMQVRAKHGSYASEFPNADYAIIVLDDKPVGRMIIDRAGEFYILVDISIAPQHRGAGIGTRLILALCMEAEMMQKKVRLYVAAVNQRAAGLYRRLGFRVIEDLQIQLLMERAPGDRAQVVAAP
jgi:ribosomal protein S18 acetylase RimI-like enzyme